MKPRACHTCGQPLRQGYCHRHNLVRQARRFEREMERLDNEDGERLEDEKADKHRYSDRDFDQESDEDATE